MSPQLLLIEPLEVRIAPAFAALADLGNVDGRNGFRLSGVASGDFAGWEVGDAGDVNGDGFSDVIIGAYHADPHGEDSGSAYVVFGKAHGFPRNLNLSALNGQNGFRIDGAAANDRAGWDVSGAGDINGDGFADILVGAYGVGDYAGAAYVIFGKAGGFPKKLNLSTLDGTNGFRMIGANVHDHAGGSVSDAGDVNGDGFGDIIVGAPYSDANGEDSGSSYVVFGKAEPFSAGIDLSALDGDSGFAIRGATIYDRAGSSVGNAGDVNGDGIDDVIVGARRAFFYDGGGQTGAAYVIFGKTGGFEDGLNLSALDGSDGFVLRGSGDRAETGVSVDGAGDINGDGFHDVIVGAPRNEFGAAFVFFGHSGEFAAATELTTLDGENGFKLSATSLDDLTAGNSVSGAGDINGDGFDDIAIGALSANGDLATGAAYVIFGTNSGFEANLPLPSLDGRNGFKINGAMFQDFAGKSVSAADVNGDGFSDLIVGAYFAGPQAPHSGAAYVVYGGDPGRLRISSDGLSATYTDTDGDRVTVRTDAGVFTEELFDMRAEGVGFQLERLDLTDPGFSHATLEFLAKRQDWNQDGTRDGNAKVDVGYLNATGVDLRSVIIPGDLGQIDCGNGDPLKPGLKSLTVQSLGARGSATQDPGSMPSLHSEIVGDMKKLTVGGGGITGGVTLAVEGRIGTVKIGGDLSDSTITALGALAPLTRAAAVAIQSITIGGCVNASQILAGYDLAGAAMNADVSIGKVLVHKKWIASDLVAGIADSTGDGFGQNDTLIPGGSDDIIARIATLRINGRATGSPATGDSFGVTAETITSATIHAKVLPLTAQKNTLLLDKTNADFRLVEL
jgi:hypothetical protein